MAIYGLFGYLDYAVYWLVRFVVKLIVLIANYDFFTNKQIELIANKVYVVLGVLVLFKIVISCVQYMVNPDTFDDKDKGMGGILKKAIICMALLVLIRPIFNFALTMQQTIVATIPGLVLDNNAGNYNINNSGAGQQLDEIGDQVAYSTIRSFVAIKTDDKHKNAKDEMNNNGGKGVDSFIQHITDGCDGSIWAIFNTDSCNYDYRIGISTLAGGFLLYVLLSMALDIGIRTIKLGIIQILAPIPISSYIVSKDKLSKFFKLAMKVYLDLFIRLAIIYFTIFFVREVINSVTVGQINIANGGYSPSADETAFIKVILLIALFMFAKNAPKFICDVLGIDSSSTGDMADMFKPAWSRIGGLSSPGAAIGAYRNARDYGEGRGRALGRALSAGTNATTSRLKAIASGKDLAESYKSSKDAASARTNKNLEYANRYPKFWQRQGKVWQEKIDQYTGVTTGGKKASAVIEAANRAIKARSNAWNRAQDKVGEHADQYRVQPVIDRRGNHLNFDQMYALFEKDAPEMYAGQKMELASQYQAIKDRASREFLRQSFAGVAAGTGDGQVRNVFAEDVFSIARSGADSGTVRRLLERDVTISGGATVHINAIDAADRINKMNQIRDDSSLSPADKAAKLSALEFSAQEAEALAIFASEMQKAGGTVRLEATKTQTSEPKSS